MNLDTSSLSFDSFNARFLSPQDVARSFEPPPHFQGLLRKCHTLVIGPRGSGKTSMLKMLQVEALRAWEGGSAQSARESVDYTGVFIATDIVWHEQVQLIGELGFEDAEIERLEDTCITLHVLRSLVTSFIARISDSPREFLATPLSDEKQRELVHYLATIWKIEAPILSFEGLKRALSLKLSEIGYFIAEESLLGKEGRSQRLFDRGLAMPSFFDLINPSVEAFDEAIGASNARWAFCFDELELAPSRLKAQLGKRLRSTTEKILFKLSMSLYSDAHDRELQNDLSPTEDDDFNVISLWYAHKSESRHFTARLVSRILASRGIVLPLGDVFGESFISEGKTSGGYRVGTPQAKVIKQLSERDISFSAYLKRRGVSVNQISALTELKRAAEIRKIYPIAAHRLFFMRGGAEPKQSMASRSSYKVYTGWDAISAICEGNPRWIIGIVSAMLDRQAYQNRPFPISQAIQWEVIEQVRHRFRSKLKTYKVVDSGLDRGAFKLLDQIGKYFEKEIFGRDFKPEPVASFRVDQDASIIYGEALKAALNIGAIVYIPDSNSKMFIGSLKEKRFRISYLLLTAYKAPLRFGQAKNLSSIVNPGQGSEQIILNFTSNENTPPRSEE